MKSTILRLAAALVLAAPLSACSDGTTTAPNKLFRSPSVAVGAGMARTEMEFDRSDQLLAFRVVFNEGALTNLPTTLPGTEFIIPMPSDAPASVFNHVAINWQPQGHPPPMVYMYPHFDVHFYLLPISARDAMTPADLAFAVKARKAPPAEQAPPRYVGDPNGIPRMGTHWTNQDSHEFHGQLFTNTMVYGFYDGKMVFIEPMMTKAYLESKPDETKAIATPSRYAVAGRYPASYRVAFDAATKEYRVELKEFAARN